jgi:type IV pilus assembly protein PilC
MPPSPSPARPPVGEPNLAERLRRAWLRHPLVAFIRHRSVITFYRQLLAMVRAGIALPTAFTQLVEFAPDAAMAQGLRVVARDVRGGATLGQALQRHAALFDDANVELVTFAEEAGRLEPIITVLIEHLDKVQAQRWQTLIAALMPLYLGGAFVFIGPLLGVAQAMTPGASVGGLYVSGLASSLSTALLLLLVVLGAPFVVAALRGQLAVDRLKHALPLVSAPFRRLAASRLVLGLGLANASGLEVVRSLRLAVKSTGSPALLEALPRVEATLRGGSSLAEAVAELHLLDGASLGSLAVAERTGTLAETLEVMSRELQASSLKATRLLMLVVVAVVAGVLLVKIVSGVLGTLLGPVKSYYDAAGSGSLER